MSRGETTRSTPQAPRRRGRWLALGLLAACLSPGAAAAEELVDAPAPDAPPVVDLDRLFELPTGFEGQKANRPGGVGQAEWRARFSEARARLERSETALAASKAQLADEAETSNTWSVAPPIAGLPKGPSDGPMNYGLSQKIKKDQREVDAARKDLLDLEVEANLANVPEAWRH